MRGQAQSIGNIGTRLPQPPPAVRQAPPQVSNRESKNMTSTLRTTVTSPSMALSGHRAAHAHHRAFSTTWHFRLLYVAGLLLILPLVAAGRLLPGRQRSDESIIVEANRAVLTALGFAFMA